MKKILILFIAAFTLTAANISAQTDVVNLEVVLTDVFDVNVTGGNNVVFTFDTPAEWTAGMTAPDAGQLTTITVDATQNWDLSIEVPDLVNASGGPDMDPANIGLYCEATGSNDFTSAINCTYVTPATCLGLLNATTPIMTNNAGNAGNATQNAFNLKWECGTQNGSMVADNMLNQVANGTFNVGTFTSIATLTLTAAP